MVADCNLARHGSAEDASSLLCESSKGYAQDLLVPALINAIERIERLEQELRSKGSSTKEEVCTAQK